MICYNKFFQGLSATERKFIFSVIAQPSLPHYGRRIRLSGIDFEANLSQGVGNFIEFISIDNVSTRVYFKQSVECQYRELRPFIVSAIQLGKLSFLIGIELLGITDYDEIQEFKKAMDTSDFVSSILDLS